MKTFELPKIFLDVARNYVVNWGIQCLLVCSFLILKFGIMILLMPLTRIPTCTGTHF